MEPKKLSLNNYRQKGLPATIFITLLFTGFILFPALAQGTFSNLRSGILSGIALGFSSFIMFMILYTGKINRWRKIFFTIYAVGFAISFIWMTMGDRGHMWLLDKEILYSEGKYSVNPLRMSRL